MTPAPIKAPIKAEMVEQIDIRVGTIVGVYDVPDSDRLVQLQVDFGDRVRTVVVGMKRERDDPSSITGRQSLFIVNLEPRRIHGVLSEAMVFDVGYKDGIPPALVCPEWDVPNGTRAG